MTRLLTALALLALSFYLVFWASSRVFIGAAVVTGFLCYREYSVIAAGHGIPKPGWLGVAGGVLVLLLPQYTLTSVLLILVVVTTIALRLDNLKEVLGHAAATIFGIFYTFAPWRFAIDLREQSVHLLFFALALNWAGDSSAYYMGRSFGKHRLAPIVSPKKSWEGAAAAVAGSVIFGLLYVGYFVPAVPKWQVVVIAIVANIAGQFGDLVESAIKRGAGLKDSGTMLPGHGGVLDRLDSSLFALPVAYTLLALFKLR
ncbi:MAG TPA: phosphatidate cytidylyltransferase [Bryobacteraceae bacterium]|jgi:phosphatidate cytidylyltransferase|nr:phosphatidate cytidylyltransferase [Bryobacteraceae bacterium]